MFLLVLQCYSMRWPKKIPLQTPNVAPRTAEWSRKPHGDRQRARCIRGVHKISSKPRSVPRVVHNNSARVEEKDIAVSRNEAGGEGRRSYSPTVRVSTISRSMSHCFYLCIRMDTIRQVHIPLTDAGPSTLKPWEG